MTFPCQHPRQLTQHEWCDGNRLRGARLDAVPEHAERHRLARIVADENVDHVLRGVGAKHNMRRASGMRSVSYRLVLVIGQLSTRTKTEGNSSPTGFTAISFYLVR